MFRSQIVAEMREACDSFMEPNNPARIAASTLGHWAIDTVERPTRARKTAQETALALLTAVRHAADDAAIVACAEALRAYLPTSPVSQGGGSAARAETRTASPATRS